MQMLTELGCEAFMERLASDAPTPGGGGGAALAAALGAALAGMVANLTVGKKNYLAVEAEVVVLRDRAAMLRTGLLELVDEDARAFEGFMLCYKMPKSTEQEQQQRTLALRAAAKKAAGVPMEIARKCLQVLELAGRLTCIGNTNAITDAACSALLARAALRCAYYNVYVNLLLTKDEDFNNALSKELHALLVQAELLEKQVLAGTDKTLG